MERRDKMKKSEKTNMGLLLLAIILLANIVFPMNVNAAGQVDNLHLYQTETLDLISGNDVVYEGLNNFEASPYIRANSIVNASLRVTPRSNEILIEVYTGCNFVATKVGVKDVLVQEKVWYGWKTIATAGDYGTNAVSYGASAHCTNAEKGKTYRVLCTHYAIDSSGVEHTLANQSEEFVYN